MTRRVVARCDPTLVARTVRRTSIRYPEGIAPEPGWPAHLRAGSSLARLGDEIAVISDDALFVALIDPASGQARCIPLPPGPGGHRLFDDERGNKDLKLDLEACVLIPGQVTDRLVAFGSGSSPGRERIIALSVPSCYPPNLTKGDRSTPTITVYHAPALYATLRNEAAFAGSELNVEGAVFLPDDTLRLVQRGNGSPQAGLEPVDATCDLAWSGVWAHLESRGTVPPPLPTNIVQYHLGNLGGVRLTFTDAATRGAATLFTACAEASPDSVRDGPVAGSALGVIDPGGARWTRLTDHDGTAFGGKVEGITLAPADPDRVYLVIDDDDPSKPSELHEVELSGPWY